MPIFSFPEPLGKIRETLFTYLGEVRALPFFCMFKFLGDTFKTLPKVFWITLAAFLGVSTITTPIAIAYLVVNSGGINYVTPEREIRVLGKKAKNESKNTNRELQAEIVKLGKQIENLNQGNYQERKEQVEELKETYAELKPTAEKVIESSEDLQDIVEQVVE